MPTLLSEPQFQPQIPDIPRKRWTRDEYHTLEKAGVLNHQRLELVEGELISKMGKNRPHMAVLALVNAWLIQVFGKRFVNSEAPIDVAPEDNPTNEPEADLIVLKKDSLDLKANPATEDLHLVVEIADTSLNFDRKVKAALYARAKISEYWIVDIRTNRLIVHRDPQAGRYISVAAYSESETVSPLAAPDARFRLDSVLKD